MLAAALGCRVISLEPIPSAQWLIENSIKLNEFEDLVTFIPGVAGSKRDEVFFEVRDSWGYSSIETQKTETTISRPSFPLDEIIEEDVLLLKIDVEGFEDEVWKGMEFFVRRYNVENIVSEVKHNRDTNYKRQFINDRMSEGYRVFAYEENYVPKEYSPFEAIKFHPLTKPLDNGEWFHGEDLWFSKTYPNPSEGAK
jgi:FkbM family methyltransferase